MFNTVLRDLQGVNSSKTNGVIRLRGLISSEGFKVGLSRKLIYFKNVFGIIMLAE